MKDLARKVLRFLHLDLTLNLKYDRLTEHIISKVLSAESMAIDVGAHKGEVLDVILKYAPKGKHVAIEALPNFAEALKLNYPKVRVYSCALSDCNGITHFNYVKNAPAYSGMLQREYAVANPEIEYLQVDERKLDDLISENEWPELIKVDVEGGEFKVLKGALQTLKRAKPVVIFEFGLGASDKYGTKPDDIYYFFDQLGYGLYMLQHFNQPEKQLSFEALNNLYHSKSECYFVAQKRS
jgi:FkbM family methyltransferase